MTFALVLYHILSSFTYGACFSLCNICMNRRNIPAFFAYNIFPGNIFLFQHGIHIPAARGCLCSVLNCGDGTSVDAAAAFQALGFCPCRPPIEHADRARRTDRGALSTVDALFIRIELLRTHTHVINCRHRFSGCRASGDIVGASLLNCLLDSNQHLGNGTMNIMYINNGRPIPNKCFTEKYARSCHSEYRKLSRNSQRFR